MLNLCVKEGVEVNFCFFKKLEKEDLIELVTNLENLLWKGLTRKCEILDKYKLYNESFINPYSPWGSDKENPYEKNTPEELLKLTLQENDFEAETDQKTIEHWSDTKDEID